jgi:site-specific recombinase XerC
MTTTHLDEFQAYLAETLSASTAMTYAAVIERALRDHPNDLVDLLRRSDISASTRQAYKAALRHWAQWRNDDALLARLDSPELRRELKTKVRERHTRSEVRYHVEPFSARDEAKILAVLQSWREDNEEWPERPLSWRWPAISMMFNLGLRAGADLALLTRADVEAALEDGVELTIATKGDKDRALPVVLVLDELKFLRGLKRGRWKVLADLISPGGKAVDKTRAAYERLRRMVKILAIEAGLDPVKVHPHRFRHSAAHRLYEATGDLLKVQRFLGHENIDTTMLYLKAKRTAEIGEDLLRARREQ